MRPRQLTLDQGDDVLGAYPGRVGGQLAAARLPPVVRKPQQPALAPQHLDQQWVGASASAGAGAPPALRAAKQHVPVLQFGHAGKHTHGGLATEQPLSARAVGHKAGPGSLPPVSGAPRASAPAATARASYASYHQQQQQHAAAAQQHQQQQQRTGGAETGPITPAQALKRYADHLTPYEQSEVLQYQQVGPGAGAPCMLGCMGLRAAPALGVAMHL